MASVPYTNEQIVQTDILRYKRNKRAANYALLSLVFECLYFMIFYSLNRETSTESWNTFTLGLSVAINLCVLLITFLAEEGIKNYNKQYCIVLLVIAAIQIIRIFYYPLKILTSGGEVTTRFFFHNMGSAEFGVILIVCLVLGAACLVASAVFGYLQSKKLEDFTKAIEDGTINVEKALKEEEVAENA